MNDGFNWEGLAELAWRATQRIGDHNTYWNWDKLSDVEKKIIERRWRSSVPAESKYRYTKMVEAACHAYVAAVST